MFIYCEKDLGVLVENDLNMSHQYGAATKKANTVIDFNNRKIQDHVKC